MRIVILDRRFSHHSAYSGYPQLIERQPSGVEVERLSGWLPRGLPEAAVERLTRRTGHAAYTRESMSYEAAALRHMARSPRAIYHVLYGEDDYHYLARVAPLLRRRGGRLAVSFHQPPDIFDFAVPTRSAARILPSLDAALVTTTEQAEHLAHWMDPERIHRVPHGVDVDFFSPSPEPSRANGDHTHLRCITVGMWQRDFVLLEQVMRAAADRALPLRFTVVADEQVATEFGAIPGVDGYNGISDEHLRDLYRESDLLLLPLTQAAANNSLLEGMACGLPVVSSRVGGVAEYLGGTGAGRLVPPFQPEAMLDALCELAAEPRVRAAMGDASRRRALEFDWQLSADALSGVYRALSKTA
jgi:glycosyltransferase involved in cell wall biosynthesis